MEIDILRAKEMVQHYLVEAGARYYSGEPVPYLPIYLHGPAGVGKSVIVRDATKFAEDALNRRFGRDDIKVGYVDERLSNFEPSDVNGIPYVSHAGLDTEEMKFSIPSWLPTRERVEKGIFPEFGVIVLDEMSNASVPVQHSAYRIILDRSLHEGIDLAKGWIIISAGNRREDKTGANEIKPALGNRYAMHLYVHTNIKIWTKWALNNNIDNRVIAFLNKNPNFLHDFDPKDPKPNWPSPRSWEAASKILDLGYSDEYQSIAIVGCVGPKAGLQFETFLKYYADLPDWTAVMDGKITYTVKRGDKGLEIAIVFALINAFSLACETEDESLRTTRIHNLDAVLQQLPDDFIGVVYRQLKHTKKGHIFQRMVIDTLMTWKRVANIMS